MPSLRHFAGSRSGNSATLFALAMVPVIGIAGAAVDYARITQVRATLSGALHASLAAVRRLPSTDPRAQYTALRTDLATRLGQHFPTAWRIESLSEADGRLVAIVTADVATTVARVIGIRDVPIRISAAADRG